jgi:hypothetical protein
MGVVMPCAFFGLAIFDVARREAIRLFRMIALVNHTLECLKGSWQEPRSPGA